MIRATLRWAAIAALGLWAWHHGEVHEHNSAVHHNYTVSEQLWKREKSKGTAPAWTVAERLEFIQNVLWLDSEGLDITAVEPPEVKVGVYPNWWMSGSVAGWYDPDSNLDVIWISEWMIERFGWDSLEVQEVITHEMTHWVDVKYRGHRELNQWGKNWQWSEENAWHVGNTYWVYMGMPREADYWWFERYGFDQARPVTPMDPRKDS